MEVFPELKVQVFKGEGDPPYFYRLIDQSDDRVMMQSEGHVALNSARNRGYRLADYLGCEFEDLTQSEEV